MDFTGFPIKTFWRKTARKRQNRVANFPVPTVAAFAAEARPPAEIRARTNMSRAHMPAFCFTYLIS
jgi:hypothetical protein